MKIFRDTSPSTPTLILKTPGSGKSLGTCSSVHMHFSWSRFWPLQTLQWIITIWEPGIFRECKSKHFLALFMKWIVQPSLSQNLCCNPQKGDFCLLLAFCPFPRSRANLIVSSWQCEQINRNRQLLPNTNTYLYLLSHYPGSLSPTEEASEVARVMCSGKLRSEGANRRTQEWTRVPDLRQCGGQWTLWLHKWTYCQPSGTCLITQHKLCKDVMSGKIVLHLLPYHLFGFCFDCYTKTHSGLDQSKLAPNPNQPTPGDFFLIELFLYWKEMLPMSSYLDITQHCSKGENNMVD